LKKNILHIIILALLVNLSSCKKNRTESDVNKIKPEFNQDYEFSNWLKKHKLEKNMFIDSTRLNAFELWAYTMELTKSDSLNFREFSTDSSYILISNFDHKTPANKIPDSYKFEFLPKGQSNYYIGISILNKHPTEKTERKVIDYHWLNSNTFILLTSETESKFPKYHLTKLKIEVDSIWDYNTK